MSTTTANGTLLAVGTRLQLRRYRDIPRFLRASMAIGRQARGSAGFVGLKLRAQFRRRTFWTVTVWTDEASMIEFVRTDPHRTTMRTFARVMTSSTSARWQVADGVPGWDEVARRLDHSSIV